MSNLEDYEKYAMYCLIECYDKKLKPMLDCKNERPDWQSNELKLGIEVTKAMPEGLGEKISVVNRYFGKGKTPEEIIEEYEKEDVKNRKIIEKCETENDVVPFVTMFNGDFSKVQQCVIDSIKSKTTKLNSGYKLFGNNWLVVGIDACGELFEDHIQNIIDGAFKEEEKLNFSKIFIINSNKLFVIEDKKLVNLIEVNEEIRKKLKDLSKQ